LVRLLKRINKLQKFTSRENPKKIDITLKKVVNKVVNNVIKALKKEINL
jgi:hypothetical protein